jgi:hypothetical protein
MLACVIEIDNLNRVWEVQIGKIPDPFIALLCSRIVYVEQHTKSGGWMPSFVWKALKASSLQPALEFR